MWQQEKGEEETKFTQLIRKVAFSITIQNTTLVFSHEIENIVQTNTTMLLQETQYYQK